jgi:hypothetical protein
MSSGAVGSLDILEAPLPSGRSPGAAGKQYSLIEVDAAAV